MDKQADKLSRHRLKLQSVFLCVSQSVVRIPLLLVPTSSDHKKELMAGEEKVAHPKLNQTQEGKTELFLRSKTFI